MHACLVDGEVQMGGYLWALPALKMCHTIVVGIDILRHKGKIVVAFASTKEAYLEALKTVGIGQEGI